MIERKVSVDKTSEVVRVKGGGGAESRSIGRRQRTWGIKTKMKCVKGTDSAFQSRKKVLGQQSRKKGPRGAEIEGF